MFATPCGYVDALAQTRAHLSRSMRHPLAALQSVQVCNLTARVLSAVRGGGVALHRHTVSFTPVTKIGGKMEGKWQVRVSGPCVAGVKGVKTLYSMPDTVSALAAAAKFLRISTSAFTAAGHGSVLPRAPAQASPGRPALALGALQGSSSSVRLSVEGMPTRSVAAGAGGHRGYGGAVDQSAAHCFLPAPTVEQARVIDLVVRQRKSVFLTGSAGTGKSFVLKHIQKGLASQLPPGSLHITAPTGIAAISIGGSTIHSFAGVGLGNGPHDSIVARAMNAPKTVERWRSAQCLILDEVSMVSADLFQLLSAVGRACRGDPRPFGGLQLVLCGDFFQLGPVNPFRGSHGKVFAFETAEWAAAIEHNVCLRQVVRQQDDAELTRILEELRWGHCSPETEAVLAGCGRPLDTRNGVMASRLYCTNASVDHENAGELARLPGATHTYSAAETGDKTALEALDKSCPAPSSLQLKVGAQVVLVWNLSDRLVNGSRGVVTGFSGASGLPVVRFNNGEVREIEPTTWTRSKEGHKGSRMQIPLKLAWALTVHRAQGMTLDKVECVLGDAFAEGQVYVALSRVTSLHGLRLNSFSASKVRANASVAAFYRAM